MLERGRDHAVAPVAAIGAAQAAPFTARLSASLPPPVKTISAGGRAEEGRRSARGPSSSAVLGRAGGGVAPGRVAERARRGRAPSPRPPRAASGWWRRGRGRRNRPLRGLRDGVFTGQVYGAGITVTPPGDTPHVTTQLRLVEPPEPGPRPAAGAAKRSARRPPRPRPVGRTARGRATTARTGRRSASWGDWRLDAGTRRVGREGVASARQALESRARTGAPGQLSPPRPPRSGLLPVRRPPYPFAHG